MLLNKQKPNTVRNATCVNAEATRMESGHAYPERSAINLVEA